MEAFHGTTIVSVRRGNRVALGGDGQVTLGNIVLKATARKVRRLFQDRMLAGFAGGTADAFTLFERFEAKAREAPGQPAALRSRTGERLAHRPHPAPARSDAGRGDRECSLIITGNGDVLEPEQGLVAIGSGGAYAQAAARALARKHRIAARKRSSRKR